MAGITNDIRIMTYNDVISTITIHLRKNKASSDYRSFFIGCSNDIKKIIERHNASKEENLLITCKASSLHEARDAKNYFVLLGMVGDFFNDDDGSIVYCYKIGMNTIENE